MKNLFKSMMLVAVAAMGFTACSKEAVEEVNPAIEKGFSLTISAEKPALESDTRTEFSDGSVIWTNGDQIRACYYHSTGIWSKYYASTLSTVAQDGSTATFTKFNPSNDAGIPLVDAAGTYTFYAGYPSKNGTIGSGTNAPTDGVLSVKVATEQTMSKAGTFDAAADIMVGKATETISGIEDGVNLDLSFNYTRLVAHGCVTLKNFAAEEGEKVLNVTFTAPADVMLTGSGSVNFVEQTMTALDNNTVTVTLPENTAATENVVVWFCSAPATIASGANLTVTVETTRGTYERTITANTNGIQFLQNRYNTLGINMASAEFVAATVESLKVTGATAAFTTEDEFVFDGTVTATLSNGYEQDVTALATVDSSEVVMTTAGTYTVTVSYGGKETSYEVTVQDASVQTQEVTITFDGGAGNTNTSITWTSDPITVVANKANGSNNPNEHAKDKELRFYAKNTLTISGATITKIEFTFNTEQTFSVSTGTYSNGIWAGSAESVTFTNTATSQAKITSVTITYLGAGGGGEEPEASIESATIENVVAAGGDFEYTPVISNSTSAIDDNIQCDGTVVTEAIVVDGVVLYTVAENTGNAREGWFKLALADDALVTATITVKQLATEQGGGEEPEPSGNVYTKVTSTADLTDGQYLIVYEDESFAFDGSLSTLDVTSNYKSVTISDNKIAVTTEMEAIEFTIGDNKKTIKSKSGNYIGRTADKNELDESSANAYTNTITINNDGTAHIVGSGGAVLRFNTTAGQDRFRYYKSSTYTDQKAITLYKKN